MRTSFVARDSSILHSPRCRVAHQKVSVGLTRRSERCVVEKQRFLAPSPTTHNWVSISSSRTSVVLAAGGQGSGKLKLLNLDRSRSYRVIWLLEELGIPFELEQFDRDPSGSNPVSNGFKIHPLGKFPMIETEHGEIIVETGAIFEYLLRKYDPENKISGSPGTREGEQINYWFHYAEGSLQLWSQCAFFFATQKMDAPQKLVDEVKTNLKFLNDLLGKQEWIAGNSFTAADVCLEFPLAFAEPLPKIDFSEYPNIQAWSERVKQRDAYKRAMEKNGEYDLKSLYAMF